jgi:hypothetical protein
VKRDGDGGVRAHGRIVFLTALAARLAVVAWAASRVGVAGDGTYYQRIAERVAGGFGYTWVWPDGVVTYAAHYPIGYPAIIGALYAVFGVKLSVAMFANAVLGALTALAIQRLTARAASPRASLVAGLLVALHPGLLAYTPALMTEGATAALLTLAAWAAAWARERPNIKRFVIVGALLGAATLVRPQCLALAPIFGALAGVGASRRGPLLGASIALATTLAVCAPWTARNCVHMKQCALVSVNGGWNLLIGADPMSTGAWSAVKVPVECETVYDEAQKDACFGRAGARFIRTYPGAWLALAPRKLAATFDYAGAGPWYLHDAAPKAFDDRAKLTVGALETLFERVMLAAALLYAARASGSLRRVRIGISIVAAPFVVLEHAWVAWVALGVVLVLAGKDRLRGPILPSVTAATLLITAATHAAFFGAGRYSLVLFPMVSALAAMALDTALRPKKRDDVGRVFDSAE